LVSFKFTADSIFQVTVSIYWRIGAIIIIDCFAASLMKSGVLKSGSPKLKLMMSFLVLLALFAKAAIANVCDGKIVNLSESGFY
jgi:hypothetical protein